MRLDDLADRVDAAGDVLAGASTTMALIDPGARAFGADAGGALGELGRELHGRFAAALSLRGRESADHGARLAETAQSLRVVVAGYHDVEADTKAAHDLDGA
jgi:hypothetical protein